MTYIAKLIYLIKQVSWLGVGLWLFFPLWFKAIIPQLKIVYRQTFIYFVSWSPSGCLSCDRIVSDAWMEFWDWNIQPWHLDPDYFKSSCSIRNGGKQSSGKDSVFMDDVQHVVRSCLAVLDRYQSSAFACWLSCHHMLLWYCTFTSTRIWVFGMYFAQWNSGCESQVLCALPGVCQRPLPSSERLNKYGCLTITTCLELFRLMGREGEELMWSPAVHHRAPAPMRGWETALQSRVYGSEGQKKVVIQSWTLSWVCLCSMAVAVHGEVRTIYVMWLLGLFT